MMSFRELRPARRTIAGALVAALACCVAVVAVASGDTVKADVKVASPGIGNTIHMAVGDTVEVQYYVDQTGQECDAPVDITLDSPTAAGASETSFTLSDCTARKSVHYTPTAAGTYDVTVSGSPSADFNFQPGGIRLIVEDGDVDPQEDDTTPPDIQSSLSPAANGDGWNNTDVTVTWTITDADSPFTADANCGTPSGPDTWVETVSTEGSGLTETCSATSDGGTATGTSAPFNIDKTPPDLNISGAASGSFDICSGGIPTRPTFLPSDSLSGLDDTEGDSWTTPPNASGVGTYTYSAHAQDLADNPSTDGRTYSVTYGNAQNGGAFSGYLQPINPDGSSRFKVGSTIPVKFRLSCNGTPVSTAVAKMYVAKGDNQPDPGVDEAISTSAATTGNLFRYDPTAGQYIFNLSTKLGYTNPGTTTPISFSAGSWTLKIGLDDGTYKSVNIQLVR